jgi:hypothetical protein
MKNFIPCLGSGFGVGFLKNLLEFFYGIMRINLGGGQAAVAQQFLYSIEVRPIVHQMGGKAVAQDMGAFFLDGGHRRQMLFHKAINRPWLQLLTFFRENTLIRHHTHWLFRDVSPAGPGLTPWIWE